MNLPFDILQVDTRGMLWIAATPTLEDAKARVEELVPQTQCDYIIFNQQTADRLLIKFDARSTAAGQ